MVPRPFSVCGSTPIKQRWFRPALETAESDIQPAHARSEAKLGFLRLVDQDPWHAHSLVWGPLPLCSRHCCLSRYCYQSLHLLHRSLMLAPYGRWFDLRGSSSPFELRYLRVATRIHCNMLTSKAPLHTRTSHATHQSGYQSRALGACLGLPDWIFPQVSQLANLIARHFWSSI